MQHKLIIATVGTLNVAFLADAVDKYFRIDRPFKIPGVEPPISWIQGVRGKCVTLFQWWEQLSEVGIDSFQVAVGDKTAASFANAVLFNSGASYVAFPVTDVAYLVEVSDEELIDTRNAASDRSIVGAYNGMFVIDPVLLFRHRAKDGDVA